VQVLGEIQEVVKTGLWVGDCFIYTSSVNRLNYFVGGEIVTIAHLDRYRHIHKHVLNILITFTLVPNLWLVRFENVFEGSLFLFNTFQNVILSCDGKAEFSAVLQSLVSHDSSEIIVIC